MSYVSQPENQLTPPEQKRNSAVNGVLMVAGVIVILAGLKAAASLLVPFLLAIFIVLIAGIPLSWLLRRGIGATAAAFISMIFIGVALFGISAIIGASIGDINNSLPRYESRFQSLFWQALVWLDGQGLTITRQMTADMVNPSAIFSYVGGTFRAVARIFTDSLLIALVVVFMLFEAAHIPNKIILITSGPDGLIPFTRFVEHMNKYLGVKTLISMLTGLLVYLMLLILSVDFAVLWGFLAFLLNYIPNIGSLISSIPVVLLTLVDKGLSDALIVTGGYIIINLILGSVLETRIMGRGLGLSTLIVFSSLIFWGWLLGPVGALLSTPLTVVVKIGLETWDKTQWLVVLLSDQRSVGVLLANRRNEADAADAIQIED